MTLATAEPCSMKTTSLPYCGSARRSAEGISTRKSTWRGERPRARGGLELALGRGLDRAADDLGGVGAGVQREGDQRAPPGLAQEGPGPAVADPFELRQPVVDEEGLHQQRRAAEEVDVGVDQRRGEAHPARAREAGGQRDQEADREREEGELQRDPDACGEERPVGEDQVNAHGRAPGGARAPAARRAAVEAQVITR